jgi:two-component system response regulator FixJ
MPTNESLNVHLIDDDEGVREALTILLAEAGFMVRTHKSGLDFLEVLGSATSGVIVSDIRMPGIDGLELQQRLKSAKHTLPLIFITGHGDIQMAVQAIKEGASDFLEKPFEDSLLIAAIHTAAARKGTVRTDQSAGEAAERIATLTPREKEVLKPLEFTPACPVVLGQIIDFAKTWKGVHEFHVDGVFQGVMEEKCAITEIVHNCAQD